MRPVIFTLLCRREHARPAPVCLLHLIIFHCYEVFLCLFSISFAIGWAMVNRGERCAAAIGGCAILDGIIVCTIPGAGGSITGEVGQAGFELMLRWHRDRACLSVCSVPVADITSYESRARYLHPLKSEQYRI